MITGDISAFYLRFIYGTSRSSYEFSERSLVVMSRKMSFEDRNQFISEYLITNRARVRLSIEAVASAAGLSKAEVEQVENTPLYAPVCDIASYVEAVDHRLCGRVCLLLSELLTPDLDFPTLNPEL